MSIEELRGKKVTVMGLGLHGGGVGAIKFFISCGAQVIATDLKSEEELKSSLEKLKDLKSITFVLGKHQKKDFIETDLVIKNPAVPWTNEYIELALQNNIPVEMDSSLFFHLCKNQIIGVTGTKGKTTTASLIYQILKTAKRDVLQVGVSQVSVLDKLKELKKETLVVFELSSWRLSALGRAKLSPQIAVITNIYPDHLNYYGTMEKYIADKENIFLHQKENDFCVLNMDSEMLRESFSRVPSRIVEFSCKKINSPSGAFINNNAIYFQDNSGEAKKVMELSEVKLRGKHNYSNILASVAVTANMGIEMEIIKQGVLEFSGNLHRLEFVRKINDVEYYNDSAATTPESAVSGIRAFLVPMILICGGANKNLDVSILAQEIARNKNVKEAIFLNGESTEKMLLELEKITGRKKDGFIVVDSMKKAVEFAREKASAGDVVLLSPGASSFGLFVNEFDRGDQFRELVNQLD